MRQVIYLTFNDSPGGIYSSQVIDTCRFLESEKIANVRLVAFVSLRKYFSFRKIIRSAFGNSIVLPMWPGIQNWRKNLGRLRRIISKAKPDVIICRGIFATNLALDSGCKVKVCFDGRGAYFSEFSEYDVSNGRFSTAEIKELEQRAIGESNFRLAVSNALISYWKKQYAYSDNRHVVIPCTLAPHHLNNKESGRTDSEIRIVFSGGTGGWQSLQVLESILAPAFRNEQRLRLVILAKTLPDNFTMAREFPGRISNTWLTEKEVPAALSSCDYGWLVRENSVTNEVASPVKFAEYLAAGLQIIISRDLGDFSAFVEQHGCGMLVETPVINVIPEVSGLQKAHNKQLALKHFVKQVYRKEFLEICS